MQVDAHRANELDADLILVGGGLANGLIAWRLASARPELRVLLLERGATLGGNHTWSFHPTDLDAAQRQWLQPLITHRWAAHDVIFPGRRRRLSGGYASVTSARFDAVLGAALGERARTGVDVAGVTPTAVTLADGRVLRARAVIDGRGVRASRHLHLGFQKFLGLEVRLASPHGLTAPILMDADVAQRDGYRFVYVLPLGPTTLLVEDTFYADGDGVDAPRLRAHIADYAAAHGWRIEAVLREEHGVLPIVLTGDVHAFWREAAGVPQSGLSAGLFHPTTGYSLPDAVALADLVAGLPDLSAKVLFARVRRHAIARWHARRFFRVLNRMLFLAATPALRWKVMHRFYGLREPLIARFYGARLGAFDKLRIVTGKPPVPFWAGVRAALDTRAGRVHADTP
jgi:lycopene beta-cyclase